MPAFILVTLFGDALLMASSFYFISLGLSWLASYDYLFISHYENISSSSFVLGLRSFTPSRARMPDRKTDFLSAFPRISSKLSSSSTIGGLGTAYSICIFLGGVETFSSIFVLLGSVEMCPCCPCCWFMPSITFSLADLFINFLLSSFKKSLFLRTVGWI